MEKIRAMDESMTVEILKMRLSKGLRRGVGGMFFPGTFSVLSVDGFFISFFSTILIVALFIVSFGFSSASGFVKSFVLEFSFTVEILSRYFFICF